MSDPWEETDERAGLGQGAQMGTLDDGNSGPFDDLPDIPADWGPIRIPDDASELADEAAQVRRELRDRPRAARPVEGGAAAGAPLPGAGGHATELRWPTTEPATEPANVRLPLLIVTAALLAAVASLFAVAWSGARRQPAVQETAQTTQTTAVRTVPALDLFDAAGTPVPLRDRLPAAIVITDACACVAQIDAVRTVAPPSVRVISLTLRPPSAAPVAPSSPAPTVVERLGDPSGEVRRLLRATPAPGHAPMLLVDNSGEVVGEYDATDLPDTYTADLLTLATS